MTKWNTSEFLEEKHFNGTFIFPHDLDFLNEVTNCQFFCDVFNDMIEKRIASPGNDENKDSRIKCHDNGKTTVKSKLDGKNGIIDDIYYIK